MSSKRSESVATTNKKDKIRKESANKLKACHGYVNEFFNNTGIHGFKYLSEDGSSWIEKGWWLIVICVCLYVCATLIQITWKRWEENPVFIGFAQTPKRVWDIPFPAVTICPENKINQTKYNYAFYHEEVQKEPHNLTSQQLRNYADVELVCNNYLPPFMNHTADEETIRFLLECFPAMERVVVYCAWAGQPFDTQCDNIFSPIFTNEGLCFTFNMLDKRELFTKNAHLEETHAKHRNMSKWTVDNNYVKTSEDVFPKRAISAGESQALEIMLRTRHSDVSKECNFRTGFKILLHHPAEIPKKSTRYLEILGKNYNILIKPDITTTSSTLNDYEPHRKNCFFSYERQTKFFKIYTQENCLAECLSNYTLRQCGCVAYHMPREKTTRICGLSDYTCVNEAEKKLLWLEIGLEDSVEDDPLTSCDCLPSCTSVIYNSEISASNLFLNYSNAESMFAYLTIYFKETKFLTIERNELFGNTDFWASCGGLLGLFSGFSVMTFIEIVYFLSLRWMCNIWRIINRLS